MGSAASAHFAGQQQNKKSHNKATFVHLWFVCSSYFSAGLGCSASSPQSKKEVRMQQKAIVTIFLITAALLSMAQTPSCTAPMNATGSYSGKWTFDVKDETGTVIDTVECPLEMTLQQDVTLNPPQNLKVTGMVHVDFSCLEEVPTWPDWAKIPEPSDVQVSGTMDTKGKLTLLSGGCGPGTCVILSISGTGEKAPPEDAGEGEIPAMATYSGEWGFAIGVAFLGQTGGKGRFDVTRVE